MTGERPPHLIDAWILQAMYSRNIYVICYANMIYNSNLIHAHNVLRHSMPRSLRRTFYFRSVLVAGLYE